MPKNCLCSTYDALATEQQTGKKYEDLVWIPGTALDIIHCSLEAGNDCTMRDETPEVMAERFDPTDKKSQGMMARNWTSYASATFGMEPQTTSLLRIPYMCFSVWTRTASSVALAPSFTPEKCLVKVATPCKMRKEWKINGNEIAKVASNSESNCCALCGENENCVAWTFRTTPEFTNTPVSCQLLSSVESQGEASEQYIAAKYEDSCRIPIYSQAKIDADKEAAKDAAEKAAATPKLQAYRGDKRCGRFFKGENGNFPAECNGQESWASCCSPSGFCGSPKSTPARRADQ